MGGVAGGQERQHINPLTHDNKNVSEKSQCILRTSTVLARLAVHRETCSTSSCLPRVFFLFFYRSMVRSILFISLPPTSLCYNWWKWCKITINTGKFLLTQHNNWHPQINQQEKKIWKTKTRSSDNFIIMSFLHFHFDFFVLWNFQCGKLRHFHLKYSKGDGDAMRNYRSKKKEYGEKQAEIDSKQIFNLSYKTYTPRWSGWFRTELSSIGDEVWTEI